MSSISPNPNPNPNPYTFQIEHRKSKKSKNFHFNDEDEIEENRKPNWLELPEDVWFMILLKLKTFDVIKNTRWVCMLFRNICKQPAMFNIIDTYRPHACLGLSYEVINSMTRFAVDRSVGGLVNITLWKACDDRTLMYIVHRSKNLKRLVLHFSSIDLIKAVEKLPMLEELQVIDVQFSYKTVGRVGRACPSLKSFSLSLVQFGSFLMLTIAGSMPQLRYLQLIGGCISDEVLKIILNRCPLLESLDLRGCFHPSFSGDLRKICEKIKSVSYPNDSLDDFHFHQRTYMARLYAAYDYDY